MAEAVVEYQKSIEIYPFRPDPYLGLGMAYESLQEDPDLLIRTWSDSIRFATRGEKPLLQEALAAVDLGDWPELLRIRGEIVAADPADTFLLRIDRVLHAAFDLSERTRTGEDWSRGNVLFRMGDWAGAEAKYVRALHQGALPGNEVPNVLLNVAVCQEHLGRPARAEHYRQLAAIWARKHR
jgi:tetratricopeptide (TPR) repeat protein